MLLLAIFPSEISSRRDVKMGDASAHSEPLVHPVYGSTLTLLQQKYNAKARLAVVRRVIILFYVLLINIVTYICVLL